MHFVSCASTPVEARHTALGERFVSYLRVSTTRQGQSGLGLEAQRQAVARFLPGRPLHQEFIEVESGKRDARPQLAEALALCRMTGATLVVAKVDRLARNVGFLLSVVHGCGSGGVVFCDMPKLPAGPMGTFMLQQMAAVAELEAGLISERTKAALAIVKERRRAEGKPPLGGFRGYKVPPEMGHKGIQARAGAFAASVGPIARELRDNGLSLRQIGAELAARGIRTPKGGQWSAAAVDAVLRRTA